MIGDASVGKTSILKFYSEKKFVENNGPSVDLDFIKTLYHSPDEEEVHFKMWDSASNAKFRNVTYQLYKKAIGFIIAFDVTNA